jgi:hypothetical protein
MGTIDLLIYVVTREARATSLSVLDTVVTLLALLVLLRDFGSHNTQGEGVGTGE